MGGGAAGISRDSRIAEEGPRELPAQIEEQGDLFDDDAETAILSEEELAALPESARPAPAEEVAVEETVESVDVPTLLDSGKPEEEYTDVEIEAVRQYVYGTKTPVEGELFATDPEQLSFEGIGPAGVALSPEQETRLEAVRTAAARSGASEPAPEPKILTKEFLDTLGVSPKAAIRKSVTDKDINDPEVRKKLAKFVDDPKIGVKARNNLVKELEGVSPDQLSLFGQKRQPAPPTTSTDTAESDVAVEPEVAVMSSVMSSGRT